MVTSATVLIVGAGGSIPYGYPSGTVLVTKMIDDLLNPHLPGQWTFPLLEMGFARDLIHHFRRELLLSRRESIDAFLEKRPDYLKIGKAAIAAALIPIENAEQPNLSDGDWYRHVANRLLNNFEAGRREKLTILTFNYDRSLDDYIYKSFKHALDVDGVELDGAMRSLEIVHLHGSLSRLPWQSGAGTPRSYGENLRGVSIKAAADSIKIIHEQDEAHEGFKHAHAALRHAERICFLGFGYHPTNVRRLLAGGWHMNKADDAIWGSAVGLTGAQAESIRNLFSKRLALTETDCLQTLRHHPRFLS